MFNLHIKPNIYRSFKLGFFLFLFDRVKCILQNINKLINKCTCDLMNRFKYIFIDTCLTVVNYQCLC